MLVTDLSLIGSLSIRDAAKGFLVSMNASNYSNTYLEPFERTLAFLAMYAEEHSWPAVGGISAEHLEEYFVFFKRRPLRFGAYSSMQGQTPSQSYLDVQYRRLNRFFGWLLDRGHIDRNPLKLIARPRLEEKVVPTVSREQLQDILVYLDPRNSFTRADRFLRLRNRAMLYLFIDTPSRRGELAAMRLSDVDFDNQIVKVTGKGRKERWMPVGAKTLSAIWEYLVAREKVAGRTDELWLGVQGQVLDGSGNWIRIMLRKLGERTGITGLYAHRFRHTYAINWLRSGGQERILRDNGGWRRVIPPTYLRTVGLEDVQKAHGEIAPADSLMDGRRNSRAGFRRRDESSRSNSRGTL